MAQVTHFFAGANSGDGFQNLFSEIVDLEDTYDLMVLKGGPGVGKATFMREIGRSMEEAGTPVEYLWCSGDPDSLRGAAGAPLRRGGWYVAPWHSTIRTPCEKSQYLQGVAGSVFGRHQHRARLLRTLLWDKHSKIGVVAQKN